MSKEATKAAAIKILTEKHGYDFDSDWFNDEEKLLVDDVFSATIEANQSQQDKEMEEFEVWKMENRWHFSSDIGNHYWRHDGEKLERKTVEGLLNEFRERVK